MTPSTLPQKLWRPLAEVKNFIEKMPEGAKLSEVVRKVKTFSELSGKERNNLVTFLNERESVLVIKARPDGGKNNVVFLRHKKYGFPNQIDGFTITSKAARPEDNKKHCYKCEQMKPVSDFYANSTKSDGLQSYCISCTKESSTEREWKKGDNYAKRIDQNEHQENEMSELKPSTPEELRKQAEALLKAAEEAEKKRFDTDFLNKKLAPVKLEVCQAAGQIQRKMDELIDATDVLNKAVQKFKELTA